jgi:hypothetical protein
MSFPVVIKDVFRNPGPPGPPAPSPVARAPALVRSPTTRLSVAARLVMPLPKPKCAIRVPAPPTVRSHHGPVGLAPPPAVMAPRLDPATSLCPRPMVVLAQRLAVWPNRAIATLAAALATASLAAGRRGLAARLAAVADRNRVRAPSRRRRVAVRAPSRRRCKCNRATLVAVRQTASLVPGPTGRAALSGVVAARNRAHAQSRPSHAAALARRRL